MRRFREALIREDGLALMTALLVTFVVFLLSVVVIRQAIHNVDASGYDQRRLRSVSADRSAWGSTSSVQPSSEPRSVASVR